MLVHPTFEYIFYDQDLNFLLEDETVINSLILIFYT